MYSSRVLSRRASRALPVLCVLLFAACSSSTVPVPQSLSAAYVDPALRSASGNLSIIVTGTTTGDATRAVERVGGRITSTLWIINAVGAFVDSSHIDAIRTAPNVVSIIANKTVKASGWNGWMSDVRIVRGHYAFNTSVTAPVAYLPQGGFVAVSVGSDRKQAEVLVANEDGSERQRTTLPLGYYWSQPLVRPDGSFFVFGVLDSGTLSHFGADGSLKWTISVPVASKKEAHLALGTDGTVYCLDAKGVLFAIDPTLGAVRWQVTLPARQAPTHTPVTGGDGSIYVAMNSGEVYAVSSYGTVRWSVNANLSINFSPRLSDNTVYVAGGKTVLAIDASSGAQRFRYGTSGNVAGDPLVSSGTVFVITSEGLTAVGSGGNRLYSFSQSDVSFYNSPVLSPDGKTLYVTGKTSGLLLNLLAQGKLYALNSANGSQKWVYSTNTLDLVQPEVDAEGAVMLAEGASITRRAADGRVTDQLSVGRIVSDISEGNSISDFIVRTDSNRLAFVGRLPNQWNGKPDVQRTNDDDRFKLAFPFLIDAGADSLHSSGITGDEVTVAVVDSGVYWDEVTKILLGLLTVQDQFIGQADFIQSNCNGSGRQYNGYCFFSYEDSWDGYGHGTHVTGTIASRLIEDATNNRMGIAPDAKILSVRVLDNNGIGSYETVINGIQYVVATKSSHNTRVMNLSLSAYATVPYFVDPLNRAAERAWQSGIVVVAAAGNTGPFAQSITVPGNDPYVITVGALQTNRTAAYWSDDIVASWSATGPTFDGFLKPDVVVTGSQIVSFMYNDPDGSHSPTLVKQHPDYSATTTLFRMNGTSMATAVTSGVVALMLEKNRSLSPDEVKYRLMATARMALDRFGQPVFNTFQQGLGRVWAPDAVNDPVDGSRANQGMNINADLSHGYDTLADLDYHYQGPVRWMLSDDGKAYVFYGTDTAGNNYAFGVTDLNGNWLSEDLASSKTWGGAKMIWVGGLTWSGNNQAFGSAKMTWAGAKMTWAGNRDIWGGAKMTWAGAKMTWAGGNHWAGGAAWGSAKMTWAGNANAYSVAKMTWAGSISTFAAGSNFRWIPDDWKPPAVSGLPPAAGTN